MVTHRILLFGGSGQVGSALRHLPLPADWQLFAPTRSECDLTQPGSISKVVKDVAPELVINAAAMTDIDACEGGLDKAIAVNFHAVANIAAQCATADAPLIHLSTDYVFDGADSDRPYHPDDRMNPLNVYGQSKMMGEEAARHGLDWHVIVRTSLVFSATGHNVLTKTLRQIDTQETVQAVSNQRANPTSADAVAEALATIGTAILKGKGDGFGTFHVCGQPDVTRFEFLQAIMEGYAPFTDRRPNLLPVSSTDIVGRVPRPAFSAMNNDKAREVYGIQPRPWREELKKAISLYIRGDA